MTFNSKYRLITTNDELAAACLELASHSVIAVDTETAFWEMGAKYEQLALIQLAVFVGPQDIDVPASQVFIIDAMKRLNLGMLKPWLESPDIVKLMHKADFDCRVLERHAKIRCKNVWCTMRADKRTNTKQSASMASLARRYFNLELDKDDQQARWEIRPIPPRMLGYAARDAVMCLWFYKRQREKGLNGAYEHFKGEQQEMDFSAAPVKAEEQDTLAERHVWLKDRIARKGFRKLRGRRLWIDAMPPYLVQDIDDLAVSLEREVAMIRSGEKKVLTLEQEVETFGCVPILGPRYWLQVLDGLYRRVELGERPQHIVESEQRLITLDNEFKQHVQTLGEENEQEWELVAALVEVVEETAERSGNSPDYSAVVELAQNLGRFDIAAKFRRHREKRDGKRAGV